MLMMNMFDMSPEIVGEMFGEYIRTKAFCIELCHNGVILFRNNVLYLMTV